MINIDPAEVMVEHFGVAGIGEQSDCVWCNACGSNYPCEPYRLADALEDVRADVAQLQSELERIAGHTRDAYEQRDAAQARLAAELARIARVQVVRRAMGFAAEAWSLTNEQVADRLQAFSDNFAEALADQPDRGADPYRRSSDA